MKNLQISLGIVTAVALSAFSSSTSAATYDFDYTATSADGTVADGELDVVGGVAVDGFLEVTAGPDVGDYTLVAGTGNDSMFSFDNIVFLKDADGLVDAAGLLWSMTGNAGNSPEINLWFNSTAQYGAPADTYSLWGAAKSWNLESYGDAELTLAAPVMAAIPVPAPAPDGGSTVVMLSCGFGCLIVVRRKLAC